MAIQTFLRLHHLTYGPLIWSKVASKTSTASVLKDGKISLEIPLSYSKIILKWGDSSHEIVDFKDLSCSENLHGLSLSDFNRYDIITGLTDLNSLFGLKRLKTTCVLHTSAASMTLTASTTSLNWMTSTASFHQINYRVWFFHQPWSLNVGWIIKNPHSFS